MTAPGTPDEYRIDVGEVDALGRALLGDADAVTASGARAATAATTAAAATAAGASGGGALGLVLAELGRQLDGRSRHLASAAARSGRDLRAAALDADRLDAAGARSLGDPGGRA